MIRTALAGLALLAAFLTAGPVDGQEIYLRRSAVVEGPRLTLGAVSDIVAADPAVRRELEAVDLGPVPAGPVLLPLRSLRVPLDAAARGRGTLIGSRLLLLPAGAVPPAGRAFCRELLEWLDGREDPEARVEVELPPGTFAAGVEADGPPARAPRRGRAGPNAGAGAFRVPGGRGGSRRRAADRLAGGRPGGERGAGGVLTARLRRWLPVAVAAGELAPGTPLTPDRVRLEEAERAGAAGGGEPLRAVPPAGQYRALARIPAGAPIPLRSLQKSLPVKGGDLVRLRFVRPGIRVALQGRAHGSGDLMAQVEVAALLTGKRFRGTVVGFQEVEIALP